VALTDDLWDRFGRSAGPLRRAGRRSAPHRCGRQAAPLVTRL